MRVFLRMTCVSASVALTSKIDDPANTVNGIVVEYGSWMKTGGFWLRITLMVT